MPKLRVHNFSISLDGFGAGPSQGLQDPLGEGGELLHSWIFETATGYRMMGQAGGDDGIDEHFARAGEEGIGATIMGRNMFGPVRGDWPDNEWKGWWGDNPPFHHQVFVLTNHPRESFSMEGGTTFNFVTGGIEEALELATRAAGGRDIRLGGGVSTVQQYMRARLIDELHIAIVPILLGSGERLFDSSPERLGDGPIGYECAELVASKSVVHARLVRV